MSASSAPKPSGIPVEIPLEVLATLTVAEIKSELRGRDVYFPSNSRKSQLLDQLKACLTLPVVKEVQPVKRKKRAPKSGPPTWNAAHPTRMLLYNELKTGNVPLDEKDMGPAQVYYNYSHTLEFQMEGIEFDDTFIRRLQDLRKIVSKEQPELKWNEHHPARKLLFDELEAGRIPVDEEEMGPAEVYYNYSGTFEFQQRGMEYSDRFVRRLRDLRKIVKRDKSRAGMDKKALEIALKNHPAPPLNHEGRPQWNGSIAQSMLEMDIAAGMHKIMAPSKLWAKPDREEYRRTLSKDQFRWKIRQVIRTKKYLHTLKHRGEEKLKAHLKDLPADVL